MTPAAVCVNFDIYQLKMRTISVYVSGLPISKWYQSLATAVGTFLIN